MFIIIVKRKPHLMKCVLNQAESTKWTILEPVHQSMSWDCHVCFAYKQTNKSSWFNCAFRGDEAVCWVSIGQQCSIPIKKATFRIFGKMIPSASIVTVYHFHTQKLGPQSSISFFLLSNIKEHRSAKGGGRYWDFQEPTNIIKPARWER